MSKRIKKPITEDTNTEASARRRLRYPMFTSMSLAGLAAAMAGLSYTKPGSEYAPKTQPQDEPPQGPVPRVANPNVSTNQPQPGSRYRIVTPETELPLKSRVEVVYDPTKPYNPKWFTPGQDEEPQLGNDQPRRDPYQ